MRKSQNLTLFHVVLYIVCFVSVIVFRCTKLMLTEIMGFLVPILRHKLDVEHKPEPEQVKEVSMADIAKLDKIEALDGQIAVLEQEKRLYQEKAKYSTKQDDIVKWNKKAAAVEVQIADKSAKVLKMRDEVE